MKASRLLITASIAALLPLAGAIAQTPPPDPAQAPQESQQEQGATFESLDVNADGKISKTEAAVSANVTAQFANYDKNGDGFIEKDEVTNANNSTTPDPAKQ